MYGMFELEYVSNEHQIELPEWSATINDRLITEALVTVNSNDFGQGRMHTAQSHQKGQRDSMGFILFGE